VRVEEREGSPVVGELVLRNQGAKPALLVAGELFEGGWQHRALNNDVLLVAGQQMVASVSCVEAGRWQGATAQVRRSRHASMMIRSAQTICGEGERQGEVWERASRYDAAFGASETSSYVDHLNRRAASEIDDDGQVRGSTQQAELAARIKGSGRCSATGVCSSGWVGSRRSWSCSPRPRAFAGTCLASRSPHHEIRGLGWDHHLLHATVFNRRHHLMEVA